MSLAWDTTADDVANVLRQHSIVLEDSENARLAEELDTDDIEKVVLHYCNMQAQTDACYCVVEDQLMVKGVIPAGSEKKWPMPSEDENYVESDEEEAENG